MLYCRFYLINSIFLLIFILLGLVLKTGITDTFITDLPSQYRQNIKHLILYGKNDNDEKFTIEAEDAESIDKDLTFSTVNAKLEMKNGDILNINSLYGKTINDDIKLSQDVKLISSQGHEAITDEVSINRISQNLYCDSQVKVDSKYGKINANNCLVKKDKSIIQFNNGVTTIIDDKMVMR